MPDKSEKPVVVICPTCGSDDVTRDALARWNPQTQDWELAATFETMACEDCGHEFEEAAKRPWEGKR